MGEHEGDDALKFYTEREWPKCDFIVSKPLSRATTCMGSQKIFQSGI